MDHYQTLTSYQVSAVMMTGARLGVFKALRENSATAHELASRLGLAERSTEALLRSLQALDYLQTTTENPATYSLRPAGELLTQSGPNGLVNLAIKESYFYDLWSRLDQVVKSGEALLPPFSERLKTEPAFIETFLLALNDLANKSADGFFAAAKLGGVKTLVDIGGGAAGPAMQIAERYPEIEITLIDLPAVLPLTRRVVREKGLESRIRILSGDAMSLGLEKASFDAALVSHLLHDFPEEPCRLILQNAHGAVRPGGRLIVHDVFTGAGPLKVAETFFDLMMMVENPGGSSHSLEEVTAWISAAGWDDIQHTGLYFGGLLQAVSPTLKP